MAPDSVTPEGNAAPDSVPQASVAPDSVTQGNETRGYDNTTYYSTQTAASSLTQA